MRQKSSKQVVIRDVAIGGEKPLICLPLLAKQKSDLFEQAGQAKILMPDLLEWRVDCFEQAEDRNACLESLKELRNEIGSIPLIFTCRSHLEGGQSTMTEEKRLKLISGVLMTGDIDIVDIELSSGVDFVDSIKKIMEQTQSRLILSYHNFEKTPSEEFIVDKLVQAEEMGADIAKVAVMPENNRDVLTLMSATDRARTTQLRIPMVTMSMGPLGAVTRLVGGQFGSDITFATGAVSSAPGQLAIADVRMVMDILRQAPGGAV